MKYRIGFLLVSLLSIVHADPIPPGQWQCLALDSDQQNYLGLGNNMHDAMKAASKMCHAQSPKKSTCKVAQSYCEQGPLSLIDDRCVVTDDNGHSWDTTGPYACKSAMSLCTEWQFRNGITSSQCIVRHR